MKIAHSMKVLRAAAVAGLAGLLVAAAPPAKAPRAKAPGAKAPASANWNGAIAVTANGSHRLGNPDAPVKLTEFVSYTCPHCAAFHKEADPVLRLTVIPKGQVSVTVTNLLRNPIDLTIAMLTNCGEPSRFFVRHNAFFATQDKWMKKLDGFSREQEMRWYQGAMVDRLRAITSDFGFYATMEGWGMSRAKVDACLADPAMMAKLRQQQADVQQLGFDATPSFTLNGDPIDAHDWPSVSKAITDRLAEEHEGTT